MKLRELTRTVTSHPYMTLVTAFILVVTGAVEAWETIEQDFSEANFGAHHGVLIFGLVSLIGVIPDIIGSSGS